MEFELLADNEEAIPILAGWYYREWGYLSKENNLENVTVKLQAYLNTDKIPLIILAVENGEILGACQLKYREMDIYPEKEHWLGGVYVAVNHRGNRVSEKLINKLVSIAIEFGVQKLYLQTQRPDGGLYSRLGWQPIERVNYHGVEVLVMEKDIGV
jgi:GNAT superfamily N-acetyltransferase